MTQLLDRVGVCTATLLADSMTATPDELVAALEATAASGHDAACLRAYQAAGLGLARTADLLADLGLAAGPVEAAFQWDGGPGGRVEREADELGEAAGILGADVVMACTLHGEVADLAAAADGFADLCQRLAPAGISVALEFLPWTAIPSLAAAWELVQRAGEPNGGILVDTWHWQRQPGGPDLATLRQIPGERIPFVQLCDAAPVAAEDLFTEAMTARRLPGEGVVDFASLFEALEQIGARPHVASEVFDPSLVADGPGPAARRLRAACSALR